MQRLISGFFKPGSPPRATTLNVGPIRAASPNTEPQSPAQDQLAAAAAQLAEESDNRVFRLERPANSTGPVRFVAFGCHGTGDQMQSEVASALNSYLKSGENYADFAILLGDLCYDWGAKSATDPNLLKCFYEAYPKRHVNLRIPFFALAGNHDENLQKPLKQAIIKEKGIPRIMHAIAHTFINPENKKYKQEISNFYNDALTAEEAKDGMRVVPLESLVHHRMYYNFPRRYYSLICEDLQLFLIDANTFALDCLNLLNNPALTARENQAAWLIEQVTKANDMGRTVVLNTHQSLYTTCERGFNNDQYIYIENEELRKSLLALLDLTDEERANLKSMSYNALLLKCMIKLGFTFDRQRLIPRQNLRLCIDLVISAHDHSMYYRNNRNNISTETFPLCQIVSGGGGGKLQNRYRFSDQDDMGFFLKRTGLTVISHTPGRRAHLDFEFITANGEQALDFHVLRFNNLSNQPLIEFSSKFSEVNKSTIQLFFMVMERVINKYLKHMGDNQFNKNITHGHDGINRAQEIWAYIRHANTKDYPINIIHDIFNMTKWKDGTIAKELTTQSTHSLITLLDEEMLKAYGQTIAEHAKTPLPMKNKYREELGQPTIEMPRVSSFQSFTI